MFVKSKAALLLFEIDAAASTLNWKPYLWSPALKLTFALLPESIRNRHRYAFWRQSGGVPFQGWIVIEHRDSNRRRIFLDEIWKYIETERLFVPMSKPILPVRNVIFDSSPIGACINCAEASRFTAYDCILSFWLRSFRKRRFFEKEVEPIGRVSLELIGHIDDGFWGRPTQPRHICTCATETSHYIPVSQSARRCTTLLVFHRRNASIVDHVLSKHHRDGFIRPPKNDYLQCTKHIWPRRVTGSLTSDW